MTSRMKPEVWKPTTATALVAAVSALLAAAAWACLFAVRIAEGAGAATVLCLPAAAVSFGFGVWAIIWAAVRDDDG